MGDPPGYVGVDFYFTPQLSCGTMRGPLGVSEQWPTVLRPSRASVGVLFAASALVGALALSPDYQYRFSEFWFGVGLMPSLLSLLVERSASGEWAVSIVTERVPKPSLVLGVAIPVAGVTIALGAPLERRQSVIQEIVSERRDDKSRRVDVVADGDVCGDVTH